MGVEPTGAGITNAHTVLKTGEATGPLPPPSFATSMRATASLAWVATIFRSPRSRDLPAGLHA